MQSSVLGMVQKNWENEIDNKIGMNGVVELKLNFIFKFYSPIIYNKHV